LIFSMNNILFIGGTHGDEPIGVQALTNLSSDRQDFDWIIGSPPALEAGTREFEGNLNRSAPGNPKANNFASRRAAEIIEKTQNYDYTIDIHGTAKNMGIFAIICNPKEENFQLAAALDVDKIVYWPAFSPELKGPLCEFFPCGLEIECGPKNDPATQVELEKALNKLLDEQDKIKTNDWKRLLSKKKLFRIYDVLKKPIKNLEEFVETTVDGETFIPMFFQSDSYKKDSVTCYKAKLLSIDEIPNL